jgi:hypothetical protein
VLSDTDAEGAVVELQRLASTGHQTANVLLDQRRDADAALAQQIVAALREPSGDRSQKPCARSRRQPGGRPGERIAHRPVAADAQPRGRPTHHLHARGVATTT